MEFNNPFRATTDKLTDDQRLRLRSLDLPGFEGYAGFVDVHCGIKRGSHRGPHGEASDYYDLARKRREEK